MTAPPDRTAFMNSVLHLTALNRWGEPQEIANAALFLAVRDRVYVALTSSLRSRRWLRGTFLWRTRATLSKEDYLWLRWSVDETRHEWKGWRREEEGGRRGSEAS